MTRALITGITGFVGSHLADYLFQNTDWQIFGLVRWRSPLDNIQALIPHINAGKRITLVEADLRDAVSLERAIYSYQPHYIFHLAAQSYPKTSFEMPVDTLDTNVSGTARLLEGIRIHGIEPIVHICSSSEVYGRVPSSRVPINEDCPFHPASPYAISKVGTDLLGQHYAQAYGMNVQITRMFTHSGARRGDPFHESSFAKQIAMIEAGLTYDPVIKVGNLNSMRTYADVRDAVRAYFMAVTVNPVPGAVYNIGGDYSCTVGETLQHLISLSPSAAMITVEQDPARMRPIDADLQIPDTSKFRAHTGWAPEFTYQQTMSDLLDYWRASVKRGAFLTR